jgi:aryl-alcohol dehydrogenase-like predicted oxidoreductase
MLMRRRTLGSGGPEVSAMGLGLGGIFGLYGPTDPAEALKTIQRAIDLGITLFDTAAAYGFDALRGPRANERLLGEAITGHRDGLVIATKFGLEINDEGVPVGFSSSPSAVRQSAEDSLRNLCTDRIDLYYQHRLDPNVPIEDTVGAMAALVKEGKVRFIGLCEVDAITIKRAHAVHPIAAIQSEYSLWERHAELEVWPTCRELGIGFVPFSPLGRGFLTGQVRRAEEYGPGDYRHHDPRYSGDNFDRNMRLVETARALGETHGASASQIALAWLLAQGEDVVPIPGTKRRAYLEENIGALQLELSQSDIRILNEAAPVGSTSGPRYRAAVKQAAASAALAPSIQR